MFSRVKILMADLFINCIAWLGVAASWKEELEFSVKILAGLGAIAVSVVTVYYKVKYNGKDK